MAKYPFDSEKKRMSVVYNLGSVRRLSCKGAAELVVERYPIYPTIYYWTTLLKSFHELQLRFHNDS